MVIETEKIGFHGLYVASPGRGPMTRPAHEFERSMMASFNLDSSVAFLFPYLNAVADQARLFENPSFIRFMFNDVCCALYPLKCIVSPFDDREHVRAFVEEFINFINEMIAGHHNIIPNHKYFTTTSVVDILKILPQTNCRECGFASCVAFAGMLSIRRTQPVRCPYIGLPIHEKVVYQVCDSTGKKSSVVTLDVDMAKSYIDLQHANANIFKLQKKISELSKIPASVPQKNSNAPVSPLTGRETDVLRMMANGATNNEIARTLNISSHTVKSHVTNIFNKLGVNNRAQSSVWAARHNLV